jgi:hypothetical protein
LLVHTQIFPGLKGDPQSSPFLWAECPLEGRGIIQ